jgi:hypothetical protein
MTSTQRRSRAPRRALGSARRSTDTTPAIRWSRILSARARIAAGYYERNEVQERLVDAVLEELRRP